MKTRKYLDINDRMIWELGPPSSASSASSATYLGVSFEEQIVARLLTFIEIYVALQSVKLTSVEIYVALHPAVLTSIEVCVAPCLPVQDLAGGTTMCLLEGW